MSNQCQEAAVSILLSLLHPAVVCSGWQLEAMLQLQLLRMYLSHTSKWHGSNTPS
jgi:hypothetical protein